MADTTTTYYSFIKPEVGASPDTWGSKLNDDWDLVDAALKAVSVVADTAAASAPKWTTARSLALTGDGTATLSVDGSANVSSALTLASVNSNTGSFGSSTAVPIITVNAKGLITAVSTASVVGGVSSVAGRTGAVTLTSSDVGLGSVENKSSATIRGELTSGNVTGALGFTPQAALGYTPMNAASYGNVENKSSATIRGEITSGNVTTALGYTPVNPSSQGTAAAKNITISTSAPSGGSDGDIWLVYVP